MRSLHGKDPAGGKGDVMVFLFNDIMVTGKEQTGIAKVCSVCACPCAL